MSNPGFKTPKNYSGIWNWNPEEGKLHFDSSFYSLTGYSPRDFPAKIIEWERRIHPEDQVPTITAMKMLLSGERSELEVDYRFIKKDGDYTWLKTKGRVTERNNNGIPESIMVEHKDITEKQKTELDIRRREENFHSLFNTLSNIIVIYSSDGKITYSNKASQAKLEYKAKELQNMEILDLYPWNIRSEAEYSIKDTLEQNRDSFSLPLAQSSGNQLLVETTLYKGYWDGKESIYHISRDVSEERRLIEEMGRIKTSVETSEDGIYIIDPAGQYLFHNQSMEKIFGLSFVQIHDLNLSHIFKDPAIEKKIYRELILNGQLNSEIQMRTSRGRTLYIHLRAKSILNEKGKLTALSYTFTDISKIKESSRQLEESEKRLNLALTSTGKGVWEWNSNEENIFLDAHSYTLAGYPPFGFPCNREELEDRIHPTDKSIFNKIWETLKTANSISVKEIFRFKRFDGSYMWVQMAGKTAENDETPINLRYVGTLSDLTTEKDRARRMELLNSIQNRLLKPGSISSKLKMITEMLIPSIDAAFARIWLIEDSKLCDRSCPHFNTNLYRDFCLKEGKCLNLTTSSGIYSHIDGDHKRIPLGAYKIGGLGAGLYENFLIHDVTKDPRIEDQEWAKRENLKSFAGFKLTDPEGGQIGVLAIFSQNLITEEIFDYLESLAGLTSQVIQNSWNLTALDKSRSRALKLADEAEIARREAVEMYEQRATIRLAVNSSSDGIAISTVGGEFFYINKTFTDLLEFNITQLAETPQKLLFEDEDLFPNILSDTNSGNLWQDQVDMLTRKGKRVPVFLRAVPFKDKNQIILGLVWNLTDISEQKESERKIEEYTRRIEEDLAEKEAMLTKARHLQKNFIQTTLPLLDEFNILALFLPCEHLGGDFFHVIRGLHDNKLVIIIGDCTDHGIKSSMDASILSSLVNQNLKILYSENRTDLFMNRMSIEYAKIADEDKFPTMFAAIIDLDTKRMYYSNANSELPVLKRGNEIQMIKKAEGLHLGYFDEPDYSQEYFDFQSGDRLLFYSDALTEIEKEGCRRLGHEGLENIFRKSNISPGGYFEGIIAAIEQENGSLPLEDDTTLIQIDFEEKKKERHRLHNLDEWQPLMEKIKNRMLSLDFSREETEKTAIALNEMCINAFVHGNQKDESKSFTVQTDMNFSRSEFIIADEGKGFCLGAVPDPTACIEEVMERDNEEEFTHGRGIWITGSLMNTIEYNDRGNTVRITKAKGIKHVRFK